MRAPEGSVCAGIACLLCYCTLLFVGVAFLVVALVYDDLVYMSFGVILVFGWCVVGGICVSASSTRVTSSPDVEKIKLVPVCPLKNADDTE
jgi:hypothetical protein